MLQPPYILSAAQKKTFSIKDFFSESDQIRRKLRDLVTFSEKILNGILHFLCSVASFTIAVIEVENICLQIESKFTISQELFLLEDGIGFAFYDNSVVFYCEFQIKLCHLPVWLYQV